MWKEFVKKFANKPNDYWTMINYSYGLMYARGNSKTGGYDIFVNHEGCKSSYHLDHLEQLKAEVEAIDEIYSIHNVKQPSY